MSRTVVLSPHADDAVWSLGGVLGTWAGHGELVIITLFNAVPEGRARHAVRSDKGQSWRYLPSSEVRQREDQRAIATLGASLEDAPFVDAAMRYAGDGFLYPTMRSLFEDARPEDASQQRVADLLASVLKSQDRVVAPLALGGHVDHRIVRDAARALPQQVLFYQDVPYVAKLPDRDAALHAGTVARDLRPDDVPCDLGAWQQAALIYRSQVKRLFGRADSLQDLLQRQAFRYGDHPVCRIWSNASTNLATDPSAASR
jgi:LmbE family N-acetylglucosaminyl deacetylase